MRIMSWPSLSVADPDPAGALCGSAWGLAWPRPSVEAGSWGTGGGEHIPDEMQVSGES